MVVIQCTAQPDKQNSQSKESLPVHGSKLLLSTNITFGEERTSSLNCFSRNLPLPYHDSV